MKKNGFTLIELLLVMALLGIVATIVVPQLSKLKAMDSKVVNEPIRAKTECIEGYKFVVVYSKATQVIDDQGHGIPCYQQ